MYSVDLYGRVRRACHLDGLGDGAAARLFGIDRRTVAKMLGHPVPQGYTSDWCLRHDLPSDWQAQRDLIATL